MGASQSKHQQHQPPPFMGAPPAWQKLTSEVDLKSTGSSSSSLNEDDFNNSDVSSVEFESLTSDAIQRLQHTPGTPFTTIQQIKLNYYLFLKLLSDEGVTEGRIPPSLFFKRHNVGNEYIQKVIMRVVDPNSNGIDFYEYCGLLGACSGRNVEDERKCRGNFIRSHFIQ
jgi:hypothetical protein